jgi:hypothetical protein
MFSLEAGSFFSVSGKHQRMLSISRYFTQSSYGNHRMPDKWPYLASLRDQSLPETGQERTAYLSCRFFTKDLKYRKSRSD